MEALQLHPCTLQDLDRLRELALSTFVVAFAEANDPEDFKAYVDRAFSGEQLAAELDTPGTRYFFALLEGQLAGYCKLNTGAAQSELKEADGLEIERIYIAPEFQGRGLGGKLLQQILDLARSEERSYVWLGVWEHNPRAIRFYERHGFVTFGKHPYYIGRDRQEDWMMRLELNNPSGR